MIRCHKAMTDSDLAELYGVSIKRLKEQVRRNISRFPEDFIFILTNHAVRNLSTQIATSHWPGPRYKPMAFSEQGVAMLSTVLNSKRTIPVNIQILRTFTRLRQMLASHKDLRQKVADMDSKVDEQFRVVFEAIKQLLKEAEKPKQKIGF